MSPKVSIGMAIISFANLRARRFERLRRLAYWIRQEVTQGSRFDFAGWRVSRQLREAETYEQADQAEEHYKRWKKLRSKKL